MSTYEISKSSLLSLKAEILRKQDELSKAKAENDVKIRNLKKNSPLDLKNKGVEQRQAQDTTEEDNLLKQSREKLEAKSKLYEDLTRNVGKMPPKQAEYCRRYLVRFDRKAALNDTEDDFDPDDDVIMDNYEPPKNRDEEWVEYIDCLGRTRTCLRKDLEYLKSKDKDLRDVVDARRENHPRSPEPPKKDDRQKVTNSENPEDDELMSSDMRREVLRKQWEKEEEELANKSDIHYQDILFNEARTHGVGYYGFSKDEGERSKQQEALRKLREETKDQQKKSQDLKAMREKQLKARVLAAKNRKRERMGLPPLEDEVDEKISEPEEREEKVDEDAEKKEEKRKQHVRPWDVGKEGVKHYEHTQEEWVDKKRRERNDEFAPPREYSKYTEKRKLREKSPVRRKEDVFSRRGTTIPPPSTYDYYGPSSSKRTRESSVSSDFSEVSESVEAGLRFLRQQMETKKDITDMFSSY